jgi:hypothetical protein
MPQWLRRSSLPREIDRGSARLTAHCSSTHDAMRQLLLPSPFGSGDSHHGRVGDGRRQAGAGKDTASSCAESAFPFARLLDCAFVLHGSASTRGLQTMGWRPTATAFAAHPGDLLQSLKGSSGSTELLQLCRAHHDQASSPPLGGLRAPDPS